ncbi:MAG: sigma-54 dependent transcriptional regulator [candidate division KSB1 bacterium]|nr:sigma-54 dependent transcriptional regulator [candidate division KSB1 bacterium]MDZ7276273.1 sigma-54 dependent transcriptional regulator [candidate division KSB1 bacterium]MDZ7287921.1 sigma-54 dependent transcriptional regulator [candidate division KSB1 bacterium]MDZ7300066.1 sigma-54 dependent transcriptional regulator [candidate division KSB1 bacterium]MDZ7307308.1 sigma-54 dependent transcriptional regulator [candidate division KSB1 bacterium]
MKTNDIISLLLIEDEEFDARRVRNTLRPFADRIHIRDVVADGQEALTLLERNPGRYDVVIMDFQIPGAIIGENLIRRIKEIDPTLQVIIVTKMTINVTDFEFAHRLQEAGAIWYCTKYPGDIEAYIYQPTDFVLNIINAFERRRLLEEQQRTARRLQNTVQGLLRRKRIIGDSPAMRHLRDLIAKFAGTNVNVMVRGPSGTGKELVAINLHYNSRRQFENFVPINCGSLPDHLIESELFGFEKGAFTGAHATKKGLFEVADGGTVFLDEITELPLSAQAKLLRVIQEGEIDKIGRTGTIAVDVRIIAATNKDLEKEVAAKRFREDLYYRLNVATISVPALAQRREDIPLLIDHFMALFSAEMNQRPPHLTGEALQALSNYDWPGNVRELQNVVQRLLLAHADPVTIAQVHAALGMQPQPAAPVEFLNWGQGDGRRILPWREMEKQMQAGYFRFVREHAGSDAEAARLLGLAPPNFHRMCKRLGIK